jgi:hydrogenase-1 operon protein HyaF
MTHSDLPIIGPNSQPGESDGAELDYLRMPGEMSTYSAPTVPEAEDVRGLAQGMAVLEKVLSRLRSYNGKLNPPIQLQGLDEANRQLVDQVLGEGDVGVVVEGMPKTLIQESVLAGVWRVQSVDEFDNVLSDHIEVADIPWVVRQQSFSGANPAIAFNNETLPEGVMNAPPLLTEINEHIPRIEKKGGSHAINLSLLPQTEQDLAFLRDQLGNGRVVILSRGYGNCRITSTNTDKVWWVQYFNSQDSMILNTLEITTVPEVAIAAIEDIADSAQRLNEILEVYR